MIPQNQKFMRLTISPLKYTTFMGDMTFEKHISYLEKLPTYVIARCPLCGASYTSKLDAHSLDANWGTRYSDMGTYFVMPKHEQVGCDHRVTVQKFVNLEGHVPSELDGYVGELHVPFVVPFLVPDDIRSVAVIHSFTICRLEDEQGRIYSTHVHAFEEPVTAEVMRSTEFRWRDKRSVEQRSAEDTAALATAVFVPRYTAYAVTYYSDEPQTLINRRMDPQKADAEEDPEYWPVFLPSMREMSVEAHTYDLPYWVKQGKLQWLDLDSPDLPLKAGPIEDFPYIDIQNEIGGFDPIRY